MNQRQAPSRARHIAIMVITISVLSFGIGYWLSVAHPAALAPYRSWFSMYDLYVTPILGIILTACGLFISKNTRARIVYIVCGLILLIAGLVRFLLH